jgi:hypothetical protein
LCEVKPLRFLPMLLGAPRVNSTFFCAKSFQQWATAVIQTVVMLEL